MNNDLSRETMNLPFNTDNNTLSLLGSELLKASMWPNEPLN